MRAGSVKEIAVVDTRVIGSSTTLDEMERASLAPKSELPKLTKEQRDFIRRFGGSEEEYARSLLAGKYSETRWYKRAEALRDAVLAMLPRFAEGAELRQITLDVGNFRCALGISFQGREVGCIIPMSIIDDLLDFKDFGARRALEAKIRDALADLSVGV